MHHYLFRAITKRALLATLILFASVACAQSQLNFAADFASKNTPQGAMFRWW